MGASRVLAMGGRLSKICVLTRPGLTAYEVIRRSSPDNRLCSSSTWSTLHSFDLAYCANLHRWGRAQQVCRWASAEKQIVLKAGAGLVAEPATAATDAGLPCRPCSSGQARGPTCLLPLVG